jgi:hypothetical protein
MTATKDSPERPAVFARHGVAITRAPESREDVQAAAAVGFASNVEAIDPIGNGLPSRLATRPIDLSRERALREASRRLAALAERFPELRSPESGRRLAKALDLEREEGDGGSDGDQAEDRR